MGDRKLSLDKRVKVYPIIRQTDRISLTFFPACDRNFIMSFQSARCAFVCEICSTQDSGDTATPSDAQPEGCTCEILCTEDNINAECPVCSAEGADLAVCEGLESLSARMLMANMVTFVHLGNVDLTGSTDIPSYAMTEPSDICIRESRL